MLIATLAFLYIVFGAGHGASPFLDLVNQLEKSTKHAVSEPARKDAAESVLKEMEHALKDYQKLAKESSKTLEKEAGNHDATAADFQKIYDGHLGDSTAHQARIIELQRQLKSHYTEEEWAAATAPPPEKKLL